MLPILTTNSERHIAIGTKPIIYQSPKLPKPAQYTSLERARTFLRIDLVPEALMVLLATSTASTRLSLERLVAHIPSHSRLSIVVIVSDLPDDVVEAPNRRPTTIRVTA